MVGTLGHQVKMGNWNFSSMIQAILSVGVVGITLVVLLNYALQDQQWAIAQAAGDKATIEVHGAMMTRGVEALPRPYLPNGLFG